MNIELKSLVVGLLVGMAITFCIAATNPKEGGVGRFQLAMVDSSTNFRVIDTRTGQVWFNEGEPKLK